VAFFTDQWSRVYRNLQIYFLYFFGCPKGMIYLLLFPNDIKRYMRWRHIWRYIDWKMKSTMSPRFVWFSSNPFPEIWEFWIGHQFVISKISISFYVK
jgi:hypothetical protein